MQFGFIVAILGRTDLFTEYTTIAIFPVLTGDSRLLELARLWGLVYAGNLIGGLVLAVLAVILGPSLGVADLGAFGRLAEHLAGHAWWVVLLSAVERYYRVMYYGGALVWAHNSHIGDARFTEMGVVREQLNIGQLCREHFGKEAALIGFGTHSGAVATACDWGERWR